MFLSQLGSYGNSRINCLAFFETKFVYFLKTTLSNTKLCEDTQSTDLQLSRSRDFGLKNCEKDYKKILIFEFICFKTFDTRPEQNWKNSVEAQFLCA